MQSCFAKGGWSGGLALNRTLTANGALAIQHCLWKKCEVFSCETEKTQVCQSSESSPPFLCSDTWKTDQSHTDFTAHSGKMMRKTVRRAFAKNKLGPHKCEVFVVGFHGAQRLGTRLYCRRIKLSSRPSLCR